jgi:hypothetical protein
MNENIGAAENQHRQPGGQEVGLMGASEVK